MLFGAVDNNHTDCSKIVHYIQKHGIPQTGITVLLKFNCMAINLVNCMHYCMHIHRGVARRKIRGFLKAMIMHGHMVYKVVVSWTHCIPFTYCSMWYQHCGHMYAREHHI